MSAPNDAPGPPTAELMHTPNQTGPVRPSDERIARIRADLENSRFAMTDDDAEADIEDTAP